MLRRAGGGSQQIARGGAKAAQSHVPAEQFSERLTSMPERYAELPGFLTQRERAAFRQPRNLDDRCLIPGMRLELANVVLRPEAPRPPLHLLCHRDLLQVGTRRLP